MELLVVFAIIGIAITVTALSILGIKVVEFIRVELQLSKHRITSNITIEKESIDKAVENKSIRLNQIREKSDELKDIKAGRKVEKLEAKILKTQMKKGIVETPKVEVDKPKVKEVIKPTIKKPIEQPIIEEEIESEE